MGPSNDVIHFILTRFNLRLWNKDKEGTAVRSREWLEHRFYLFEQYCLPSIKNQTCKDFEWIVLFDSSTPDEYKGRIDQWQAKCSQLIPIFVQPAEGRNFASIFRQEVIKRLKASKVITTYLDNDDALDIRFVEDLQARALKARVGQFINYTDGYQYYTDHKYLLRIHYPRNHFISVVEKGTPDKIKTIYGYGSHYYIEKIPGVKIEYVRRIPIWCEVIHEKNMGNDAYFLWGAKIIGDKGILQRDYAINETIESSFKLYVFRFLPRYFKTFLRRIKYFLFGRQW